MCVCQRETYKGELIAGGRRRGGARLRGDEGGESDGQRPPSCPQPQSGRRQQGPA